jgi:hypothetical protein
MIKIRIKFLLVILFLFGKNIAFSQLTKKDSIIPNYFFEGNSRNVNKSILQRGDNDTIYSFIGTIPIYRLIIHKGRIKKFDLIERLKMLNIYDKKGRLVNIMIEDTLRIFKSKVSIKINFYPRTGRIKSCTSRFLEKLEGANFSYSSRGKMLFVFDYNFGKIWGYGWQICNRKTYRYDIYYEDKVTGSTGLFDNKHKLLAFMSVNDIDYHKLK